MSDNGTIKLYIESPDSERFECDVPADIPLSIMAAQFFEDRGWPTLDSHGRGQRAVVEMVDPNNPGRTKRLRSDQTVGEAGLWNGAILRVFPESIAGRIDERERVRVLVADHRDMEALAGWNRAIRFKANLSHAPTLYTVTFDLPSFDRLEADGHTPHIRPGDHQVEIYLGAEYPRQAPQARWLTPIFHPNIHPANGAVCLGVLRDRYLPGLGVARLVNMLCEMAQWRNFDTTSALNKAAAEWAADPAHWEHIVRIGGAPFQGPVNELFEKLLGGQSGRRRITFTPVQP